MPDYHYPEELPICARRGEILAAIRNHPVVVIAGETGSGKTTQLPKMCLEAGFAEHGKIGCTQPRRVAALSVSKRVAEELKVTWGREVGCKMRFSDDTAHNTRIKFMTDGILLAEIQSDPLLRGYSALIIDEAHERSLNIDFLLGYLQQLRTRRPDLKLVITSATIDTEAFSQAFGGAPIIEVSGRLWPVEVRYAPLESFGRAGEEAPDYIEAAVRAAEDALLESDSGDVLIFMPTERDIRETRELLEGTLGAGIEVLGLFGRMPAGEQQRVFSPGPKRRVIVATNVAETSLTLPRIGTVIDTGLARISRYNPRTRTKRLPVEAVSQSSANQRTGRAGRVQNGVSIRLFDEADFEKRPRFTQPEIQRANLAEVILRMKAFRLGEIETFPFLNPPQHASIRAGYRLLHELGALDETNQLTHLGRELARLPLDPTLGRMLLHAHQEGALPEMLIIAAGLSVPDPRERPEDQKEAAANAHAAFADPESDFLTLLNIWKAGAASEGRSSSNALRRFCKTHFLSFNRMREWRDIHQQLCETFAPELRSPTPVLRPAQNKAEERTQNASGTASRPGSSPRAKARERDSQRERDFTPLHRSILTGLLSQIAERQERNTYKAAGNRTVTLFPGSGLHERREKTRKNAPAKPEPKSRQPQWIMAGEIVETSQLFARMTARIQPEWIPELGAHLCEFRHTDPRWSARAERVLATERVLLQGLEVARRNIDFGRIDPVLATEIFIRGALVAGEARIVLPFFQENQRVRERVENAMTRVRNRQALELDEILFRFYAQRIEGVSSLHDLHKLVKERSARDTRFLHITEEELSGEQDGSYDRAQFPDKVELANQVLPVHYAFSPGEETDGVTVRVPLPVAGLLTTGQVQWMVPGLREEQISVLLRALPKSVRKTLHPLEPKIRQVARQFEPGNADFLTALALHLCQKYGVSVRAEDWPADCLPAHLRPRIEIIDQRNQTVSAGRDLQSVQEEIESRDIRSTGWEKAARRWEKRGLTDWNFGDLPPTVTVEEIGGVPLLAYPGLECMAGGVNIRLFRKEEEARASSPAAVLRLGSARLSGNLQFIRKEMGLLAKQLATPPKPQGGGFQQALQQLGSKLPPPAGAPDLQTLADAAQQNLLQHALRLDPVLPLSAARFETLVAEANRNLPGLAYQLAEWVRQLHSLRQTLLASPKRYPGMESDIARILPPDFIARTPYSQIPHLLRYLRAIQVRAERAHVSPVKDAEKARQLLPFAQWEKRVSEEERENFRWMLEEFRVSLFAQELGTAQSVSARRLETMLQSPGA